MKLFRFLLNSTKKEWLYLSLGFFLSLITAIAGAGLLSVAGFLIGGAAIAGSLGMAAVYNYMLPATGVRFFALVRLSGRYGDRVVTHEATFRILKDLRVWFYGVLEPLAPGHLILQRSGDLLSRMIADIDALDKLYLRLIVPFGTAIILIILTSFFSYFFSPSISLIFCFILIITVTILPILSFYLGNPPGRFLVKFMSEMRVEFIGFTNYLMDLILYGKADQVIGLIQQRHAQIAMEQKKQANIRGLINVLTGLLTGAGLISVLFLGIQLFGHRQLMGANLALLALMVFAVFEVINNLPHACQYLGETWFSAQRLSELQNIRPLVDFENSTEVFDLPDFHLAFDDVSFRYNEEAPCVLKNVKLDFAHGSKTAIAGSTGAGKSTLALLATRCFDPAKGTIFLGGRSLRQFSEKQLRDSVCYIPQNSHIFNAGIRENLLIGKPEADDDQLYSALKCVNLDTTVKQLPKQLDTLMGEFGKHFSGGEIRRFSLARAFLKNAPITILDEPFEGVDMVQALEISQNIQRVFKEKTVIVITHQRRQIPQEFQVVSL